MTERDGGATSFGWGTGNWTYTAQATGLAYDRLLVTGGAAQPSTWTTRNLESAHTGELWFSFLLKVNSASGALVVIPNASGDRRWGLNNGNLVHGAWANIVTSLPVGTHLIVTRYVTTSPGESRLWLNPTEEQIQASVPPIPADTRSIGALTSVTSLQFGNSNAQRIYEIRMGRSWRDVLPLVPVGTVILLR